MTLKLRIKKVYFDQIKTGLKDVEYRADSVFYRNRFSRSYDQVEYYYGPNDRLIVNIVKIERVPNPIAEAHRPPFLNTDYVFAIHMNLENK